MKVLWVTTFGKDMWEPSARHLVDSFIATKSENGLLAFPEGMDVSPRENVDYHRIDNDPFLRDFLRNHSAHIPRHLGGTAKSPECRCRRGPFGPHDKRHKLPCIGYWFCKNAFRWLRKVVALKRTVEKVGTEFDILMWVDSDCFFTQQTTADVVASWFPPKCGCIYMKSKRQHIETGVVGYHLHHGGRKVIEAMAFRYATGLFRGDQRWDDCAQLGAALKTLGDVRSVDVATSVGERSTVVQFTPMGAYLTHDKGRHNRGKVMV